MLLLPLHAPNQPLNPTALQGAAGLNQLLHHQDQAAMASLQTALD